MHHTPSCELIRLTNAQPLYTPEHIRPHQRHRRSIPWNDKTYCIFVYQTTWPGLYKASNLVIHEQERTGAWVRLPGDSVHINTLTAPLVVRYQQQDIFRLPANLSKFIQGERRVYARDQDAIAVYAAQLRGVPLEQFKNIPAPPLVRGGTATLPLSFR